MGEVVSGSIQEAITALLTGSIEPEVPETTPTN